MLALKLFTGDSSFSYDPVLKVLEAYPGECGIEVAFYDDKQEYAPEVVAALKKLNPDMLSWHSHHVYIAFDAFHSDEEKTREYFLRELASAQKLGVNRMIIHHYANRSSAPELPPAEVCAMRWLPHIEYLISKGVVPYFENTFEPLDWVRALYEEWTAQGLSSYMGFCLDIGHVRAYSGSTLAEWDAFVDHITALGFKLHYHIHANDGSADQHLAFHLANDRHLLAPSADWAADGIEAWLNKSWKKKEGNTLFLLEHSSHLGLESYEFTRFMLEQS